MLELAIYGKYLLVGHNYFQEYTLLCIERGYIARPSNGVLQCTTVEERETGDVAKYCTLAILSRLT